MAALAAAWHNASRDVMAAAYGRGGISYAAMTSAAWHQCRQLICGKYVTRGGEKKNMAMTSVISASKMAAAWQRVIWLI